MKSIALIFVGCLAAPIGAFAGGPVLVIDEPQVVLAPVIAQSVDWTGVYSGVALGYGTVSSGGVGLDGTGALAGVHLGYRHDFGRTVVGGELSYETDFVSLGSGNDSLDATSRLKFLVGVDMGRTLLYFSAGAARADATLSGASASDQGYFGGIGADFALTDQWTIGGEECGPYRSFRNMLLLLWIERLIKTCF